MKFLSIDGLSLFWNKIKEYIESLLNLKVNKSGDTITGIMNILTDGDQTSIIYTNPNTTRGYAKGPLYYLHDGSQRLGGYGLYYTLENGDIKPESLHAFPQAV